VFVAIPSGGGSFLVPLLSDVPENCNAAVIVAAVVRFDAAVVVVVVVVAVVVVADAFIVATS